MTPEEIVDGRRIVVCVGSGGVGKTTISASLALGGARRGRRVLVLTIDPAKRPHRFQLVQKTGIVHTVFNAGIHNHFKNRGPFHFPVQHLC